MSLKDNTFVGSLLKLPKMVTAACAGMLLNTDQTVQAVAIDDLLDTGKANNLAQIDAHSGLSTQDLVDGMLNNMA